MPTAQSSDPLLDPDQLQGHLPRGKVFLRLQKPQNRQSVQGLQGTEQSPRAEGSQHRLRISVFPGNSSGKQELELKPKKRGIVRNRERKSARFD